MSEIYTNNLKNREYGKEAAQIFVSGASDHCLWQGASEDQKFAAKPTPPETDSSGYLCIWNDLKKDISRARQILSQETLSYDDVDEIAVLRGKIQDGRNWVKSIDFTASSEKCSSKLAAKAIEQSMLATAKKADGILIQFQEPVYQSNETQKVAAATGLASAAAIAFGYSLLPTT